MAAIAAKKRVKGKNFSSDEELLLCRAWLHVSQDPRSGTGQKYETLWENISKQFHETRSKKYGDDADEPQRPTGSLQKKWSVIQHDVSKFCGSYASVCDLKVSGSNDEDTVELALDLYKKTNPTNTSFAFLHCWELLKTVPKWQSFRSPAAKAAPVNLSKRNLRFATDDTESPADSQSRPLGNKRSKKLFSAEAGLGQSFDQLQQDVKGMAQANLKKAQALEDQTHMALFSMDVNTLPDEDSRLYFKMRKAQVLKQLMSANSSQNEIADDQV
jgi:hypothetical protein